MKLQISDPYGENWESKLCRWKCYILIFLLNEKKIQVNLRRSFPSILFSSFILLVGDGNVIWPVKMPWWSSSSSLPPMDLSCCDWRVEYSKWENIIVIVFMLCSLALCSDELAKANAAVVTKDAEVEEKNTTIAQVCMLVRLRPSSRYACWLDWCFIAFVILLLFACKWCGCCPKYSRLLMTWMLS